MSCISTFVAFMAAVCVCLCKCVLCVCVKVCMYICVCQCEGELAGGRVQAFTLCVARASTLDL